jgi:hypothetical protein
MPASGLRRFVRPIIPWAKRKLPAAYIIIRVWRRCVHWLGRSLPRNLIWLFREMIWRRVTYMSFMVGKKELRSEI